MINLPSLNSVDFSNKKVVVRGDLDIAIENNQILEESRLLSLLPTLQLLLEKNVSQILLIGHRGRPEGEVPDPKYSLSGLVPYLKEKLKTEVCFVGHQPWDVYYQVQEEIFKCPHKIILLENLRFWPQEEENNLEFATQLAYGMDIFVNEAFASSHRAHSSIVGLPTQLPSYFGLHFTKEIENLSKVHQSPPKPVIALVSGVKKDKIDYINKFEEFCDKVLIAGRLPEFMPEEIKDSKLMVAKLNPDKEDITLHSIENFEEVIADAGTIILSGPPSRWEDSGHELGTKRTLNAIANSKAFKVAGGGDTQAAINHYNLAKNFDWVSSGGGASLEFLANKTLPGIDAIVKK